MTPANRILATVSFVQTPEGIEMLVDSALPNSDVLAIMEAALEAAEPPDTPENRAAGAWGFRRGRRD